MYYVKFTLSGKKKLVFKAETLKDLCLYHTILYQYYTAYTVVPNDYNFFLYSMCNRHFILEIMNI